MPVAVPPVRLTLALLKNALPDPAVALTKAVSADRTPFNEVPRLIIVALVVPS